MEVTEPCNNISKIAIMGGTFDPVHNGHIKAVEEVISHLSPELVLAIPNNIPPHKVKLSGAGTSDRFEMLRLAFLNFEQVKVSDIELRRKGKSYTIDTLTELRRIYPISKFYLILGTDMLLTFEKWYRFKDILHSCTLVAMPRLQDDVEAIRKEAVRLNEKYQADVLIIPINPVEVSSTTVRRLAKQNEDLTSHVPLLVADYIKKTKLYMN
jgi:nicotinate-nucleotide adenylyltransferase